MRKDLRVALQNLVSPPFSNLNYPASPTNFFLFQPSGEEEWQYHPPCGPLAHSTLLFPSIATSSIQFNPIFQLFASRKYHLFGPIQADLPLPLQQRFFCAEWYAFARDVRSNYLPQFGAISLRIKESQVEVPASAIPSEVAYHLLAFIDFVDTLSLNLPAMDMMRGLNGEYAKCLIYQGIGDEVKAVEAARRLLVSTRCRLSEFHVSADVRTILPAFVGCACLLQYGRLTEAERNYDLLELYVPFFASAQDALSLLRAYKASLLPVATAPESSASPPSPSSESADQQVPLLYLPAKRFQLDGSDSPGPFLDLLEDDSFEDSV